VRWLFVVEGERLTCRVDAKRERPSAHENSIRLDVAAGRQRPAPQQHGRALPQLQRGQHCLVVLFLVLNDHARCEQLVGGVCSIRSSTRPRTSWS
jgi:hypothetical protein